MYTLEVGRQVGLPLGMEWSRAIQVQASLAQDKETAHPNLNVEQVAQQVNMSKRNFIRRFKQATHFTPLEYTQRVKIEAAKRKLESSTQNIQNLMFDVRYNDIKTFRDIFKRLTGVTPKDYRKKYGLNAQ